MKSSLPKHTVLGLCALLSAAACSDVRHHELGAVLEDGGADAGDPRAGRCQLAAQDLTCGRFSEPVCGCDLVSYPSPCDARDADAGVQHGGLCTPDECRAGGRVPVQGNGDMLPLCPRGAFGFPISGREPGLCCE